MDGKGHLIVGIGLSAIGVYFMGKGQPLQPTDYVVPVLAGAISSLVPDLDHDHSTLTNKLSYPVWLLISAFTLMAGVYIGFHYGQGLTVGLGIAGGFVALCLFHRLLRKRIVLTLVGLGIIVLGVLQFSMAWWIILLGAFVAVASRLNHRGLTHSLLFLLIWTFIAYLTEQSTGIKGIMIGSFLGYLSHLVADHLLTKTKIKWLQPLKIE